METKQNIYDDFAKIKLCIESCKTYRQLGSSQKLIDLFIIKHKIDPCAGKLHCELFMALSNKNLYFFNK